MIRLALLAAFAAIGMVRAADPDPAKLLPTAEQTAQAQAAATLLGSANYLERERASRELELLGRLALPVIDKLLAETGDAEVRSRCEALRPAMAAADLRARLDAFNADLEGKYDHKLQGWEPFAKAVGKTAAARKLFSEMYEISHTARLLALTEGKKETLTAAVLQRRGELYARLFNRERVMGPNGTLIVQRQLISMPEVAAQVFAEGVLGGVPMPRNQAYVIQSLLMQSPTVEVLRDPLKGEILRKLVVIWCETRVEMIEVYYAMNLANQLAIKEIPVTRMALKLLAMPAATSFYKANAITLLAREGGKNHLADLIRQFDDKTVFTTVVFNPGGVNERVEVQIRDLALAMAIIVSGEKVEDYGMTVTRVVTDASRFNHSNYRFANDQKREAAFKKWNELHPAKK